MPTKPTDIELIRQVMRENNSHAFEVLMQRYTPQVYGAALRLMRDEDDAAEVVQMAFIQAYRQLDTWRGEYSEADRTPVVKNFGAWVTIIANHIALRLLEKEKRRQKVPLDENADLPDEAYNEQKEERLQSLEQAVSCLPEQDQRIIQWHYYEGLSLQTIADRLGQTENNIKVRLFRIRERLKKKLSDES